MIKQGGTTPYQNLTTKLQVFLRVSEDQYHLKSTRLPRRFYTRICICAGARTCKQLDIFLSTIGRCIRWKVEERAWIRCCSTVARLNALVFLRFKEVTSKHSYKTEREPVNCGPRLRMKASRTSKLHYRSTKIHWKLPSWGSLNVALTCGSLQPWQPFSCF